MTWTNVNVNVIFSFYHHRFGNPLYFWAASFVGPIPTLLSCFLGRWGSGALVTIVVRGALPCKY